ncbi:MAG: FitA-like ribbon-helix-helix domain-containing protein [Longimicrobiales bacterium]
MSDIVVRDMPDRDVTALTRRAERSGWSLESEIRQIVMDAAREERAWQDLVQASETMERQLERTEWTLRTRGAKRSYRRTGDPLGA